MARQRRRRRIMGAAFVNANANMEVRRAEGDRQIAIEHPDMGRR